MIPTWAKVGAKVVCIRTFTGIGANGKIIRFPPGTKFPVAREIYTIRAAYEGTKFPAVYLEEIRNPIVRTTIGMREQGFMLSRFRPLVSLESDMETHFVQFLHSPEHVAREKIDG